MLQETKKKFTVVFPVIGAENLSVQALSANLKRHDYHSHVVFDPALFDDKNFLSYPWLGDIFSQKKKVIKEILRLKPDLVAFSVMTPTFHWAEAISKELKEALPDIPIIYGGVHPTLVEEKALDSFADIICTGEGDEAILDLVRSMENGEDRTDIPNLWFKKDGKIISNPQRPIILDLDSLPSFDKESYDNYLAPRNNLLAVSSRGCPFNCSFCSLYKYAEDADEQNVDRVRLRSPRLAVNDLKVRKEKYNPTWIEFKDNTFTANKKWVREFLPLLKKEVNLPFKCFVHPSTLNHEIVKLLKDNGCWGVQIGIESMSEYVRSEIINRKESNTTIDRAFRLMDEVGLPYSIDYILGLPKETEEDLIRAAEKFIELKACHRVSPFLLAYLPKHPLTTKAHELGILSDEDIENLENGDHDHYLGYGSLGTKKELRMLLAYKYFFRMIPHLPRSINRFILKSKLFKVFSRIPFFGEFVVGVDVFLAFCINEPDIKSYTKHYLWTLFRVLSNRYFPKEDPKNPPPNAPIPLVTSSIVEKVSVSS
jgi:anaerobic magnesium-protoporphyrin IX monomethyl ester cyclase